MTINELLQENDRRRALLPRGYDPIEGNPDPRLTRRVRCPWEEEYPEVYLPLTMLDDPDYPRINSRLDYQRLRFRHDFEYWAVCCYSIRHKITGEVVSFVLNNAQRLLLRHLEDQRLAEEPIRAILLKARQWGGTTLVTAYFAWIQIVLKRNWNSAIVGHTKDIASLIRLLYCEMLMNYPEEHWDEEEAPKLKAISGSQNARQLAGRGAKIVVTSSSMYAPSRGFDIQMAHLSEVAYWCDSKRRKPADIARSVISGIPKIPLSVVVLESTADGIGNYFHRKWNDASAGRSSLKPIFVPWHAIEMYSMPVDNPEALWKSLTSYERSLWDQGLTLEQIAWYHYMRLEMDTDEAMFAEFPSTPSEAFVNTGMAVFPTKIVEDLRPDCHDPLDEDLLKTNPKLADMLKPPPGVDSKLQVWKQPDYEGYCPKDRYVIAVDIGGRSIKSDYSVISVLDRFPRGQGSKPEIVAQWRGHGYHDQIATYAAAVGRAYRNALLVVESNTLETEEGGGSQYILERLAREYRNMYCRRQLDIRGNPTQERRVGFHTNRSTKPKIIANLLGMVRDHAYTERDDMALDEMLTYQQLSNGSYAAKPTCHDDILMTRAIALYVAQSLPRPNTLSPADLLSLGLA